MKILTLSDSSKLFAKGETAQIIADDPGPDSVCVVCVNGEPWYSLTPNSRILIVLPENAEVSIQVSRVF